MKKAYSYFRTVEDVKALGIEIITQKLFDQVEEILPTPALLQILQLYEGVPSGSEKAKSELLITPIFNDIRWRNPRKFTYFSGYQLNVLPEKGLRGFCDFIISQKYNAILVESPLIMVVEAKLNQDLPDALPQCIAQMYAAEIFNQRNNSYLPFIYGAITNGNDWLFLKLQNNLAIADTIRYGTLNLPQLLGVWQIIIDQFSTTTH